MSTLHVVICNERLIQRFGVDRLLLQLGAGLRNLQHRISFVCLRCDEAAVRSISPARHVLSDLIGLDLVQTEVGAAAWLRENWAALRGPEPMVLVSGGWPFFSAAVVCAELGVPSVFIDAGAVPHDGMSEGEAHVQRELRRIRARTLPLFTAVLPISNFIRDTQTLPDRGTAKGVEVVRLGADHLAGLLLPAGEECGPAAQVERLRQAGGKPVLALGRYEAGNYKNSAAVFSILAELLQADPDVRLLLLAREDEIVSPPELRHAVVPLGYLSDAALEAVMRQCVFGLSLSRWEGFNLPLAEMQWHGIPVLAFNVGAHPEVAADAWLLCGCVREMAGKAARLLRGERPPGLATGRGFDQFRRDFTWTGVTARYAGIIAELGAAPSPARGTRSGRAVFVDCSCAARDPANPGVIRVVRRACHALQRDLSLNLLLLFIVWDAGRGCYRFLNEVEQQFLSSYDGPIDGFGQLFSQAGVGADWPVENTLAVLPDRQTPVLFFPEVVLDGHFPERLAWAAAKGLRTAAILYDLIPVTHIPLCAPDVVREFPHYLEALACTDALWAISGASLHQFERYARKRGLPLPPDREAIWLPGQFADERRRIAAVPPRPTSVGSSTLILSVGSIEPRKNHRVLVAGFRSLLARRPDLSLRLVLVGHRFGGAEDLALWIEQVTKEEPRITWTGLLSDPGLAELYEQAAFSIYPSLVEGFGLPIMESLWMGRPCICHSDGVMAELAAGGGCLVADMNDPESIADAIEKLATQPELYQQLTREAGSRAIDDWRRYASHIGSKLTALGRDPAVPCSERQDPARQLRDVLDTLHCQVEALRLQPEPFVQALDVDVASTAHPLARAGAQDCRGLRNSQAAARLGDRGCR